MISCFESEIMPSGCDTGASSAASGVPIIGAVICGVPGNASLLKYFGSNSLITE